MRNLILGFLVFITSFLNAQSVDPETFPTVVGAIGSKNLYTNTGGEGKISIKTLMDSVDILDTATITYADFYTLITGGNLVVGKTYIIMDFQTVYDQMDFDAGGSLKPTLVTKTGATEQIWVLALAPNQIASQAYSATYPNDEIKYDWTYNTTLVNGSPAKGRISERIDENNNRTDYDHREIKFIRYDDGAGNFTVINDNGNASAEFLTFVQNFTGGIVKDNWLGDFYSIGASFGQEYANNVFSGGAVVSNKSSSLFYNNTFLQEVLKNIFNDMTKSKYYNNVINTSFNGIVENLTFVNTIVTSQINGYMKNCTFNDVVGYTIVNADCNNIIANDKIRNCIFNGSINNTTFDGIVEYSTFNGVVDNTYFESDLYATTQNGNCIGKTFTIALYPFLFSSVAAKDILSIDNGDVYIRYFDGTSDVNTLIP